MKRLMPDTLKNFLATTPNVVKADCFVIELPTGGVLLATEGQFDITFLAGTPGWAGPQTTFRSVQYGVWTRGNITSEAGFACSSNTMTLTCIPQADTSYPGLSLGVLNAALNHLFDGATVWVYTAYFTLDGYGDVSTGIETKMQGTITKTPTLGRNRVDFEVADPLYALNMKVPSRLMQSGCPWNFADANCTLDPANYTANVVASNTATGAIVPATAMTQPDGYFAQGPIKCLTGENAGLSQTVKTHKGNVLTLVSRWILPVAVGDTFAVLKGCDKTPSTCAATNRTDGTPEPADFRLRFGGTPFVPAPSSAV